MPEQRNSRRSRKEQQDLLKRIENPKTPADVLAASQNPYSPLNRELLNNLIAGLDFQLAVEKTINALNETAVKEDAKQKEEILRHEYQGDELEKMKQLQQVQAEQALRLHKQALQQVDIDHLRTLLSAKIETLGKAKVELVSLSDRIDKLDIDKNVLSTKLDKIIEKKHEDYKTILKETGLRDANGHPIDPEKDAARIEAFAKTASGADGPSFVDIMQKISDSQTQFEAAVQNATKERKPGFLAAPPPPPPPPFSANIRSTADLNLLAARFNALNHIKALGNDAIFQHGKGEGVSVVQNMLGLLKANRPTLEQFKRAEPDEQSQQVFRGIALNRGEASKLTEERSVLKNLISLTEDMIKVEKDQYRFLGGKESDLKVQSDHKQELSQEKNSPTKTGR